MIRMIGLDLDGTLLTRDKRLTTENEAALREASRRGVFVVPVTGRPCAGIPQEVSDLRFIVYAITSNGAVTTDLREKKIIRARCMTPQTAALVIERSEGENVIREYFARGYGYHDAASRQLLRERFGGTPVIEYLRRSRIPVEDFPASLMAEIDEIENISIMCRTPDQREKIREKLEELTGIRIILPWKTDLEITSDRADKGEALLALGSMLGLRQEEIMAIGDGNNDLGLMKAAGLSIAMGNSDPDVLEAADHVTEDNEHDGVAQAIRRYVL